MLALDQGYASISLLPSEIFNDLAQQQAAVRYLDNCEWLWRRNTPMIGSAASVPITASDEVSFSPILSTQSSRARSVDRARCWGRPDRMVRVPLDVPLDGALASVELSSQHRIFLRVYIVDTFRLTI